MMRQWLSALGIAVFGIGCAATDGTSYLSSHELSADPIRIATYNIHHWRGADEVADVERIGRVIDSLDADVVVVQEADNNLVEKDGELRRQELLSQLLGRDWVTFDVDGEPSWFVHGNAVLLGPGVELIDARHTDVSEPGRDPRAFTETLLEVRGQRLRVIGAHLGLNLAERQRQIEQVARAAAEPVDADGTVLAGDFNEWNPLARTFRPVRGVLRDIGSDRSFPAGGPLFRLDRIWTSDHAAVERVEVVRNAETVEASDHLPVRAELFF